jgi:hypothetical protein
VSRARNEHAALDLERDIVRRLIGLNDRASRTRKVWQALKKTSRNISATPESKLSYSKSSAISFDAIVGRACSYGVPPLYATQPPLTINARPLYEGCLV